MAAPLPLYTRLAASSLRSISAPWERGGVEGGLSSGHGVRPGDRVVRRRCGTGRAQRFHTAHSLPHHSLLRLRHPPPKIPCFSTRKLGGPDQTGVHMLSSPKDPQFRPRESQACFNSAPTPDNAADRWACVSGAARGNSTLAGTAASSETPLRRLARARPCAAVSSGRAPFVPSPSCTSWALKAGGCVRPQAEAAAGTGGPAQELSERRAPPPKSLSLPPSFPQPALPAHPSPRRPPPAVAVRSGCRTIKQASQRPPSRTPARRPSPCGSPLAARAPGERPVAGRGAGHAGAGRGAETAGAPASAAFSGPGAATPGGMGGR